MQSLHTKLPPMNTLAAFESSARHLSFTRAGEELQISREAVSRKIRILEDHLGVKLFVRLYRALKLTEAGEAFHSTVVKSLEDIAHTTAELRRLTQPTKITITATIAIASFWLTQRLPRYREEHPEAEIHVTVADEPIDLIGEGIDIGLRYGDGNWSGLKATKLFDVISFPVCSPGYLRDAPPIETPRDLLDQTLLYLDGTMHSHENWDWWVGNFGLQMPDSVRVVRFNSYANVIQAALEGQGVALGFSHINGDLLSKGLLVRPIEDTCFKGYAVYLVVPGGVTPTPNTRRFFDWIVSEAKSEPEFA